MKDYPLFAKQLQLNIHCPDCDTTFSYDVHNIPSPNWEGDTVETSQMDEEDYCVCPRCKTSFNIDLYANIYYAELCVRKEKTGQEIDSYIIKAIEEKDYNKISTMKNFQDWFEERVKTQYGDIQGVAYLDGHEGPGDIRKLFATRPELQGYSILGFDIWYNEEQCDKAPNCMVYAVKTSVLKSKGVNNLDYYNDIEEISLEQFKMSELNVGIKRLHYGFAIPTHLIK